MKFLLRFLLDPDGATAVEYAVMLALIIGVAVVSIGTFGTEAAGTWGDTSTKIETFFNGGSP